MARQYALPASDRPNRGDPRGLSGYIRETATKYGVDPEVALKVARSEGLSSFQSGVFKNGKQEPSFGAFQLYTGGGLGNKFKKETGLDPADPANEKATIDYALKYASQHGWGSWYGAKNTGIGEWDGIGGGAKTDAASGYGGVGSDAAASERAARVDTTAPDVVADPLKTPGGGPSEDFIGKLQDPRTGMATGLSEAIQGLGQATASTGLAKGMYDTGSRPQAPAPALSTPGMTPMVDPRMAENQRQQLAMAMQRLNSGRLY